MTDENGMKVLTQWMAQIDKKLDNIHTDLGEKADREELNELRDRVDSAHKKLNYITGVWAGIIALVGGFFGFKT